VRFSDTSFALDSDRDATLATLMPGAERVREAVLPVLRRALIIGWAALSTAVQGGWPTPVVELERRITWGRQGLGDRREEACALKFLVVRGGAFLGV
jgi:hypothetical protein